MRSIRTSTCRNAKAREGKYAGGCPPLGYKAVNGELVVDEPMADIVRMIFAKRNAGATLASISSFLNNEGYKTRKDKQFYPSTSLFTADSMTTAVTLSCGTACPVFRGHIKPFWKAGCDKKHEHRSDVFQ